MNRRGLFIRVVGAAAAGVAAQWANLNPATIGDSITIRGGALVGDGVVSWNVGDGTSDLHRHASIRLTPKRPAVPMRHRDVEAVLADRRARWEAFMRSQT